MNDWCGVSTCKDLVRQSSRFSLSVSVLGVSIVSQICDHYLYRKTTGSHAQPSVHEDRALTTALFYVRWASKRIWEVDFSAPNVLMLSIDS